MIFIIAHRVGAIMMCTNSERPGLRLPAVSECHREMGQVTKQREGRGPAGGPALPPRYPRSCPGLPALPRAAP